MQRAGSASEGDTKRLASRLADADFVSLRCRADGDALAATGILTRALDVIDTPFQAAVCRPGGDRETATGADLLVRIGLTDPNESTDDGGVDDSGDADGVGRPDGTGDAVVIPSDPTPASLAAIELARELGVDLDPVLALAGSVAASVRDASDPFADESAASSEGGEKREDSPDSPLTLDALCEHAREDGRLGDRQPGIALATTEPVDGLTHTTLAHTAFSGNVETARERCGRLAEHGNDREIASLLALSVVGTDQASPRAARAIEQALRPVSLPESSSPFVTLEGYADVLGAVAAEQPGIGLALACGYDVRQAALSAWRTHARWAHAALRAATVSRYDGLCVARLADDPSTDVGETGHGDEVSGDEAGSSGSSNSNVYPDSDDDATRTSVATIARLFRDFRSPEPVALVVGDGIGAIAAIEDRALGVVVARATRDLDGTGGGSERLGEARFDGSPEEFVTAVRTELANGPRTIRSNGGRPPPSRETGDRS